MKQSVLLVGGGVIARHYASGLARSNTLHLAALVDRRPDCLARECFSALFYTDLHEALELRPQAAILALPPTVRTAIAKELLDRGVAVLTEKPMAQDLSELEALLAYARETGTPLKCLYHWKAADEVRFLKAHGEEFGAIRSIRTRICDDYANTPSGAIRPDRRGLLGAWYDSGINVLSYYDEILDLHRARTVENTEQTDSESGQCKYVRRVLDLGGASAEIVVDWTTPSREKTSELVCENGRVLVNHSRQSVTFNGETVYAREVPDRLTSHYENLFRELTLSEPEDHTLLLHKILFTGDALCDGAGG